MIYDLLFVHTQQDLMDKTQYKTRKRVEEIITHQFMLLYKKWMKDKTTRIAWSRKFPPLTHSLDPMHLHIEKFFWVRQRQRKMWNSSNVQYLFTAFVVFTMTARETTFAHSTAIQINIFKMCKRDKMQFSSMFFFYAIFR